MQAVVSMTLPQMTAGARMQVVEAQHDLWADDEIRWHVQRILDGVGNNTRIMLDPLISSAVVACGQAGLGVSVVSYLRSCTFGHCNRSDV